MYSMDTGIERCLQRKNKSNYLSTHTIIVKKLFNVALNFEILGIMFAIKKEKKKKKKKIQIKPYNLPCLGSVTSVSQGGYLEPNFKHHKCLLPKQINQVN